MSNWQYYKVAKEGFEVYVAQFPEKSGNLKFNATTLKSFRFTRKGARWVYNTSGSIASYAEPVNDGYRQYIFGKPTGKFIKGQRFYEKGALAFGLFVQRAIEGNGLLYSSKILGAKQANKNRNLDSEARKLVMNRSIELTESGRVKVGKPSFRTKNVG